MAAFQTNGCTCHRCGTFIYIDHTASASSCTTWFNAVSSSNVTYTSWSAQNSLKEQKIRNKILREALLPSASLPPIRRIVPDDRRSKVKVYGRLRYTSGFL